jgi:hypothetical protein
MSLPLTNTAAITQMGQADTNASNDSATAAFEARSSAMAPPSIPRGTQWLLR